MATWGEGSPGEGKTPEEHQRQRHRNRKEKKAEPGYQTGRDRASRGGKQANHKREPYKMMSEGTCFVQAKCTEGDKVQSETNSQQKGQQNNQVETQKNEDTGEHVVHHRNMATDRHTGSITYTEDDPQDETLRETTATQEKLISDPG